jgi:hypothetical protein
VTALVKGLEKESAKERVLVKAKERVLAKAKERVLAKA